MTEDSDAAPNGVESDGAHAVGSRCEIRIWQTRFRRNGEEETVLANAMGTHYKTDDDYAIVVNQDLTKKDDKEERTILTINSPHIIKACRDVVKSHPTVAGDFSGPFDISSPYQVLLHYWEELHEYTENLEDDEARMHMKFLWDFVDKELGSEKARLDAQLSSGNVTFNRLWTIYRPGDLQITFTHGHPRVLELVKTAYEQNNSVGKYFEIYCRYTDSDGKIVGSAKETFRIVQKREFAGELVASIKDLSIFPLKYHAQEDNFKSQLMERAAKFLTFKAAITCQYDGLAEYLHEPPYTFWDPDMAGWGDVFLPYTETGRVVIDRTSFQEDHQPNEVARMGELTDHDKMLCPSFVYGYSLGRKEWCRFFLTNISPICWDTHGFDTLFINEDQKMLLKAQVSAHMFPDNARDQAQQKSKGLVILLHGSPGSGKTLTAERAAESTKKALISTSMSELNKYNSPWHFERGLQRILQYATTWKAIVLLDEADVFLDKRTDSSSASLERNAMVAVFLRHLEYFSGIVFLTTNRVHVFDEAMINRTHLAIGYRQPSPQMRKSIWAAGLKGIPADQRDFNLLESVELLCRQDLSGRAIKNTINTAQTLARSEGHPLQLIHINKVLGVRSEFEATLKDIAAESSAKDAELSGQTAGDGFIGNMMSSLRRLLFGK